LPQWIQSPGQVVAYLDRLLRSRPFSFRNASASADEISVERAMHRYIYEEGLSCEQDSVEELYGDEPKSTDDVPEAHEDLVEPIEDGVEEELPEIDEPLVSDEDRWINVRDIKGLRAAKLKLDRISRRRSGK